MLFTYWLGWITVFAGLLALVIRFKSDIFQFLGWRQRKPVLSRITTQPATPGRLHKPTEVGPGSMKYHQEAGRMARYAEGKALQVGRPADPASLLPPALIDRTRDIYAYSVGAEPYPAIDRLPTQNKIPAFSDQFENGHFNHEEPHDYYSDHDRFYPENGPTGADRGPNTEGFSFDELPSRTKIYRRKRLDRIDANSDPYGTDSERYSDRITSKRRRTMTRDDELELGRTSKTQGGKRKRKSTKIDDGASDASYSVRAPSKRRRLEGSTDSAAHEFESDAEASQNMAIDNYSFTSDSELNSPIRKHAMDDDAASPKSKLKRKPKRQSQNDLGTFSPTVQVQPDSGFSAISTRSSEGNVAAHHDALQSESMPATDSLHPNDISPPSNQTDVTQAPSTPLSSSSSSIVYTPAVHLESIPPSAPATPSHPLTARLAQLREKSATPKATPASKNNNWTRIELADNKDMHPFAATPKRPLPPPEDTPTATANSSPVDVREPTKPIEIADDEDEPGEDERVAKLLSSAHHKRKAPEMTKGVFDQPKLAAISSLKKNTSSITDFANPDTSSTSQSNATVPKSDPPTAQQPPMLVPFVSSTQPQPTTTLSFKIPNAATPHTAGTPTFKAPAIPNAQSIAPSFKVPTPVNLSANPEAPATNNTSSSTSTSAVSTSTHSVPKANEVRTSITAVQSQPPNINPPVATPQHSTFNFPTKNAVTNSIAKPSLGLANASSPTQPSSFATSAKPPSSLFSKTPSFPSATQSKVTEPTVENTDAMAMSPPVKSNQTTFSVNTPSTISQNSSTSKLFGNTETSGFGNQVASFNSNATPSATSGFGNSQSSFNSTSVSNQSMPSMFNSNPDKQTKFGPNAQSSFGGNAPNGFGNSSSTSAFGNNNPTAGFNNNNQNSTTSSGLGNNKPGGFGSQQAAFTTNNNQPTASSSGFGNNQPSGFGNKPLTGFGTNQAPSFGNQQSAFGIKPGSSANNQSSPSPFGNANQSSNGFGNNISSGFQTKPSSGQSGFTPSNSMSSNSTSQSNPFAKSLGNNTATNNSFQTPSKPSSGLFSTGNPSTPSASTTNTQGTNKTTASTPNNGFQFSTAPPSSLQNSFNRSGFGSTGTSSPFAGGPTPSTSSFGNNSRSTALRRVKK